MTIKKIKIGKKYIIGLILPLQKKKLIVLRGQKGYVMCGYINLRTAEKFNDAAIKITGVSAFKDVFKARIHSCTSGAKKLGIKKGDAIRDILKLIV